jgi:hypothetical protein
MAVEKPTLAGESEVAEVPDRDDGAPDSPGGPHAPGMVTAGTIAPVLAVVVEGHPVGGV